MPRVAPTIELDAQTQNELERLARTPSASQAVAERARLVLAAAQGITNQHLAATFHLNVNTVGKWRTRFCVFGLPGLASYPPGRGPKYGPRVRAKLLRLVRQPPPGGRERWTLNGLARALHMPRSSVYDLLLIVGSKSRRQPAKRQPRN